MTNTIQSTAAPRTQNASARAVQWGIAFSLAFTALIWTAGGRLDDIRLLPDTGATWYWKLPEPTFWTRATAWCFYALHQVSRWGLICYAQTRVKRYTPGLHRVNWIALGMNTFFIVLHFIQTHLWYDGLAKDVSIWSSQASVALLLVAILLMENQRRGLFFGRKAPISKQISRFVRQYHGYVFAWATVYTFWYHPMVNTSGHLIGFLYVFLLMLQGSLFFTRIHVNKWWTFAQEIIVLFHGALVALMQGNQLWPMFFFGFAGIFLITQMHSLGLKRWQKLGFLALYVGGAPWVYSSRGSVQLNETIRIPLIEYLAVAVLAGLTGGGLWFARRVKGLAGSNVHEAAS